MTQIRVSEHFFLPELFDCVTESRLLCGFLVLTSFFPCFFLSLLDFLTLISSGPPEMCSLITLGLQHCTFLAAYSQGKIMLGPTLDIFPGSALNYGWHIKLSEPWLCRLDFYGWICSQ